jgi:DNA-binding transcriptional MerR regulator
VAEDDLRYAIGDLASLGGVSRRTVRYYVQEGLLPAPFGVGRGNHYGREHLAQLRVKALQEAGQSLDEIRRALTHGTPSVGASVGAGQIPRPAPVDLSRALWRRLPLSQGVELHVQGVARLPSAAALRELTEWCERHLAYSVGDAHEKDEDPHA